MQIIFINRNPPEIQGKTNTYIGKRLTLVNSNVPYLHETLNLLLSYCYMFSFVYESFFFSDTDVINVSSEINTEKPKEGGRRLKSPSTPFPRDTAG